MKRIIALFLILLTISFPLSLITKSGEFFTGQVLEENDEYITLMGDSGVFEILKEEIKEKIITFDEASIVRARDYGNKKGLRFSYASGIGEQIPVFDTHEYADGSTKDVFINQISEIGLFYYLDLPQNYSVECGAGVLERMANIAAKADKNKFNSTFISCTVRRMLFNSLNGGYHFNIGMGINRYSNNRMKASGTEIKYRDALGYHALAEIWSNMPKVWIFDDLNFVMSLRWTFGASFIADEAVSHTEWQTLGLNGFLFNTSLAFLF